MAKHSSSRRNFVKDLALGSAAVALGGAAVAEQARAEAGLVDQPSQAPRPVPRPADTGERITTHHVEYASGIPLGGIGALAVVLFRTWQGRYTAQAHAGLTNCATYWHFMDLLWVYLFILLFWV